MSALGLAFEWARAAGLWTLVLPVALFLFCRARRKPPLRATGTLFLWRKVAAGRTPRGAGTRPSVPPAVWLVIGALVCGALALAGPRFVRPEPPRLWTVVVDHSPSSALALRPGEPHVGTRLEAAWARAEVWLEEHGAQRDRVRWISSVRPALDLPLGKRPDAHWFAHPRWFASEPRWERYDEPGVLFVTDRAPEVEPARAGFFASGGPAVAGTVFRGNEERWSWNGETITTEAGDFEDRRVVLADNLPDVLARMFRIWAEERGFVLGRAETDTALIFLAGRGTDAEKAHAARDGWQARGTASRDAEEIGWGDWETWLSDVDDPEFALVRAQPGAIGVAWSDLEEPAGDPAAFAVSWSRLFDRWVLPPSDVVPVEERRAAGDAGEHAPDPAPFVQEGDEEDSPWADRIDSWLAMAAALLGLGAVSVGRSRLA